jgi:Methyltransferase domain
MIKHRSQLGEICELGHAAELGCAEGLFSLDLLKVGFSRLYMVDNYATIPNQKGDGGFPQEFHDKNFKEAMERIKPFSHNVTVLRGMSTDMAKHVEDESLSLLYLDGDHSYEGVMNDLYFWYPKVKFGGIVAGHDFLAPQYGVFQAVHDYFISHHKHEIHIIPEDRDEDAGFYVIKN